MPLPRALVGTLRTQSLRRKADLAMTVTELEAAGFGLHERRHDFFIGKDRRGGRRAPSPALIGSTCLGGDASQAGLAAALGRRGTVREGLTVGDLARDCIGHARGGRAAHTASAAPAGRAGPFLAAYLRRAPDPVAVSGWSSMTSPVSASNSSMSSRRVWRAARGRDLRENLVGKHVGFLNDFLTFLGNGAAAAWLPSALRSRP